MSDQTLSNHLTPPKNPGQSNAWVYSLLLSIILGVGAVLRLTGIYWGEFTYMHPDERFLIWVGTDIQPIGVDPDKISAPPAASQPGMQWRAQYPEEYPDCEAWGGYFDAACSPLNPHNRSHTFYVYGTLPMFLTRYIVEWIYNGSGFVEMTKVGRPLSALADLMLVALVYLSAARLYNRRVGLLASAFSALAVLQIQQSHFFTMDTFITFFTMLAVYFALRISQGNGEQVEKATTTSAPANTFQDGLREFMRHPFFWLSVGFGVSLGLAVASKLNAALVAWVLPAAILIRWVNIPAGKRERWLFHAFGYMALAGALSLLVFRIFQPYAFTGPGFFGLKPNPMWVSNIRELMAQGAGDIDFPPSLQWARRSIFYSGQNLVQYGLGLPLGILAWAGFLWAGWKMLRGEWQRHLLLWSWTAFYFGWQSLAFNPTMRYQLPVYPTLAIFAAWAIIELYDHGLPGKLARWGKPFALGVGGLVVLLTAIWAVAFTRIYTRPFTRVDASRWIYQNIPGPINVAIETETGSTNQIIALPYNYTLRSQLPFQGSFTAKQTGIVHQVSFPHIADRTAGSGPVLLDILVSTQPNGEDLVGQSRVLVTPIEGGHDYNLILDQAIRLEKDQSLFLTIQGTPGFPAIDLCEELTLTFLDEIDTFEESLTIPNECASLPATTLSLPFSVSEASALNQINFAQVIAKGTSQARMTSLTARIIPTSQPESAVSGTLTADFAPDARNRGKNYTIILDQPLAVIAGQSYQIELLVNPGGADLSIEGSYVANEGDWDDGLPLRLDGYDGFGGIYKPGLNFNMYTDDNPEKLERFLSILDQTDYIFISSNRQWGSLPRLPERFPFSTLYYRNLLGCPPEETVFWCYAVAQVGDARFQGSLGFELVYVSQSNPTLGPIEINDQFAEEAFHVYEHPKVLIFRKTQNYNAQQVRTILSNVNFEQIVRLTPKKAGDFPATLQLPEDRLAEQQQGGTWSDYFNPLALHNRFQFLGVIIWYGFIWLLGLLVYPALRLAMPGLSDRGYPLARIAGLLVLAYMVWLAGSYRIPVNRLTIGAALLLIAAAGAWLAFRQREELRQEWAERRNYFILVEMLTLGFFLLFLLVRFGNPDLWHPWKGGEKPMDFAYFNAVLRSTSFPPYDPWFSGGYLNYYYYGFVIAGVPVKFLGLVPSFAYNLILPSFFSLTAMGAFSVAWNLARARRWIAGSAGAISMVVLGNLGSLRMIVRGYQILVDPKFAQEGVSLLERWGATFQGVLRALSGQKLPYSIGDWYWIPSRVMPPGDNAITEMPAFTFIYADPHAHLFALPVALFILGTALAVILGRLRWRSLWGGILNLGFLALAIGATRPTNTWDYPTYLALGVVSVAYTFWRYTTVTPLAWQQNRWLQPFAALHPLSARFLVTLTTSGLVVLLANLLYAPYTQWYGQGYSAVSAWTGPVTPLGSYFTHWGLFLFVIVAWLAWESVDWMAKTPLSSMKKLEPYTEVIILSLALLLIAVGVLVIKLPGDEPLVIGLVAFGRGVVVALISLPLAAWAGVLLLRPGQSDVKRIVLFLIGTALMITLVVEMIVLLGDIGRQNTVFKLYLQAWTLLSISAGAAFTWLLNSLPRWNKSLRAVFQISLVFLVSSAALFPMLGGTAKINDRMTNNAPHTLDGMAYMQFATYNETGFDMDLSQDYRAIRWMQDNIAGSPVIVEANSGNLYRWYGRFSIYTGLPGVVGWEWHQQQQRALTPPDRVSRRLQAINQFYATEDSELAADFLQRYNVKYVVVGQLERASYPAMGIAKFSQWNGTLWQEVYRDQDTQIYEVQKP